MRCPQCGRENTMPGRFCVFCGAALEAPAPPSSPAGLTAAPAPSPATPSPTAPAPSAYAVSALETFPELRLLPSVWREPYRMAVSQIRLGRALRWAGVILGGAFSVLLLIPAADMINQMSRLGVQATGFSLWLIFGILLGGAMIGVGLYALGTLVWAGGFHLLSLLNLELQAAPEGLLGLEEGSRLEALQAVHGLRQRLLRAAAGPDLSSYAVSSSSSQVAQVPCPWCGELVYVTAKACPSCFRPLPGRT